MSESTTVLSGEQASTSSERSAKRDEWLDRPSECMLTVPREVRSLHGRGIRCERILWCAFRIYWQGLRRWWQETVSTVDDVRERLLKVRVEGIDVAQEIQQRENCGDRCTLR